MKNGNKTVDIWGAKGYTMNVKEKITSQHAEKEDFL